MKQWQCAVEADQNIRCAGGWVIGLRSGQAFFVADQSISGLSAPSPNGSGARQFVADQPECFVGGSGRNVRISGAPNTLVPSGYFKAYDPASFAGTLFAGASVAFNPDDSVDLHDGTDVLASAPPGTLATTSVPTGTFVLSSTAYGESTYTSGTPFTVGATPEADPGAYVFPGVELLPNGATVPTQTFSASDADHYAGDVDATWSIIIHADGSADVSDGTDVVATRTEGTPHEPSGTYSATAYGLANYLATDAEDFFLTVQMPPGMPMDSWVYVVLTESSPGVIGSVEGPFRGDTLPSSSSSVFYVPIGFTESPGVVHQLQDGPILWAGPDPIPVTSVAGKTGDVELEWKDIKSLPLPTFEEGKLPPLWLYDDFIGASQGFNNIGQLNWQWGGDNNVVTLVQVGDGMACGVVRVRAQNNGGYSVLECPTQFPFSALVGLTWETVFAVSDAGHGYAAVGIGINGTLHWIHSNATNWTFADAYNVFTHDLGVPVTTGDLATTGDRYRFTCTYSSSTTADIRLEVTGYNLTTWSTVYSGTVAISLWTTGPIVPHMRIFSSTSGDKDLLVDYFAMRSPAPR
ncbi:MAG: hypothetical protein QM755_02865 [Luteolibacter sp.]